MREDRSGSQILFGFLPEQTVDLRGGIWKVKVWPQAEPVAVDPNALRAELQKQVVRWANNANDGGYSQDLFRNVPVRVVSLNKQSGVRVERFPRLWKCSACDRVRETSAGNCQCGTSRRPGQLPFVAYHDDCGALKAPWIPKCPTHRQVRVRLPGTASAAEIRFECPECNLLLRRGFGFANCECGRGRMSFNVHRAASVYTPRSLVMVNPPSLQRVRRLSEAGGAAQALDWALSSFEAESVEATGNTTETLRADLRARGFSASLIEQFVAQAIQSGELTQDAEPPDLADDVRRTASAEAVQIALALLDSRKRVKDLAAATEAWTPLGELYRDGYPTLFRSLFLEDVELVERFPVLTGVYGYTRGDSSPGESRLVPFRDRSGYLVYGDVAETEALFFRLDPLQVVEWLRTRGHAIPSVASARSARVALLQQMRVPDINGGGNAVGAEVLTLIHSWAHSVMRQIAVFAGVDRNGLSEFLLPHHLGFMIYAAAKGDFVLGGLQAVFETELHNFLRTIAENDYRCPLDPGCRSTSGACVGCLHVGEPSCRLYNQFLSRSTLRSSSGYFSALG